MLRCLCIGTRGNATALTGRLKTGIRKSVMWSPSARNSRPIMRRAASWKCVGLSRFLLKRDRAIEDAPPSRIGSTPMLLSPFRPRTAHVVELRPVRIEQRAPKPAPPPSNHVDAAAWRSGRKQYSRHVRVRKAGHFEPPLRSITDVCAIRRIVRFRDMREVQLHLFASNPSADSTARDHPADSWLCPSGLLLLGRFPGISRRRLRDPAVMDVSSGEATVPFYGGLIRVVCWLEPLRLRLCPTRQVWVVRTGQHAQ
jgi:hypothetical protein